MLLNHLNSFEIDLRRAIDAITDSGIEIDRIYLFGSYAYGEPDECSDMDLFVLLADSEKTRWRIIDAIVEFRTRLYKAGVLNMDILVEFESDFSERADLPTLEHTVSTRGVIVYERKDPVLGERVASFS
jgi:predicted nucleotidyltransferase